MYLGLVARVMQKFHDFTFLQADKYQSWKARNIFAYLIIRM